MQSIGHEAQQAKRAGKALLATMMAAAVDPTAFENSKGEAAAPIDPKLLAERRRLRARNEQKMKAKIERRRREKQANASRRRNRK